MKISVIIPCKDMGSTLQRAIDSALPQAHEVFIVDDKSTDATPDVMALYATHPKVKSLHHAKNQGVVVSRNEAIMLSDCDWFVPLDADDKLADNVLSLLRVNVDATTFAYGDWLEYDETETPQHKKAAPIQMIKSKNVAKATFLFSRSMWETVGGYDADFEQTGGEDWAFMLALVNAGYRGVHVEVPIYHYQANQDALTGRAAKVKQHEQQILQLFNQKYPNAMR